MPKVKPSDVEPAITQQSGKVNPSDVTPVDDKDDWLGKGTATLSAPPAMGSIPWMKQKAYSALTWGANQLPTIEGAIGGFTGGAIGGVVAPTGGEVPGAIIGAGIGGAAGSEQRKAIQDWEGYNDFEDPKKKTVGAHLKEDAIEGGEQAGAELFGMGAGKVLRPTLERSLAKLYFAGNLKYGDPLRAGDLETVINDIVNTEKQGQKSVAAGGRGAAKATTVRDFLDVINQSKKELGQQVDLQMSLPIQQNGRSVMLGNAHADPTKIVNAITSKATDSPSIVKLAKLNPAGKEAAYLESIRKEALNFQQHPWTYSELTDRRIHLNQELAPLYSLTPGEQRVYLLEHPDLAYKKAEAEAIRETVYPEMDRLSNNPPGTTEALQNKRGALMSLENQVNEHLGTLKTKARQAKGAPLTQKANISSYGTSSGKPGFAVHRLTGLVHTPNVERQADKKVAQAFGNTVGSKVRSAASSPFGNDKLGNEMLSLPLRELVNPAQPNNPEDKDKDSPGPQSSVSTPRELLEKAKQVNPAAQGQTAYNHTAVNPQTGHVIGSRDGVSWFDFNTGEKVA